MTREDAVMCSLMAVVLGLLLAAVVHDVWFWSWHECRRSTRVWHSGTIVGGIATGGDYQPSGYRSVCVEWTPSGGHPWLQ